MTELCDTYTLMPSEPLYKELLPMTRLAKNLYNTALYNVRQHYFNTGKYLSYASNVGALAKESQRDYVALPRKVSQWVCRQVDLAFKSFFGSLGAKRRGDDAIKPRIPKYLPKDGTCMLTFTNQAVSAPYLRKGLLKLSGCECVIRIIKRDVRQVKVIPRKGYLKIQVVYLAEEKEWVDNGRMAGIDIGLDNLATVGGNTIEPFIVNGRPVKSINQYYNKKSAELMSRRDKARNPAVNRRRLDALGRKRDAKIADYMHKASRELVNRLASAEVTTVVIGRNRGWKQDINLGRRTNQSFVMAPLQKFIDIVTYKCRLAGIRVVHREESYTSKSSFIDRDPIPVYGKDILPVFSGKRVKRGLYRTASGILVNADLNGALNILRKEVPNAFDGYGIEVCSTPVVLTMK